MNLKQAEWDDVLPYLNKFESNKGYKASEIILENRMSRGIELDPESVSQLLREAVVLLLKKNSSYKVDLITNEVIYILPTPNSRELLEAEIKKKSRIEFFKRQILPLIINSCRFFIGFFLFISLFLVILALLALLVVASNSGGRRNSGGGGGFFHTSHHSRRFWLPFRFWYWPAPIQIGTSGVGAVATAGAATAESESDGMSFVEGIFSFIFGDGGLLSREESQAQVLRTFLLVNSNKKLKAIQFVPFLLDPPPLPENKEIKLENEKFMATILWRFQGFPTSTNDGALEYQFPSKNNNLTSGSNNRIEKMFREKKLVFSLAPPSQQKFALILGVANFLALLLVTVKMRDENQVELAILRGGIVAGSALKVVTWIFPFLLIYSIAFLLIPACRLLYINRRNKQIDVENDHREQWRRRIEDQVV